MRLVKWHHRTSRLSAAQLNIHTTMPTIKIDNQDYDLDTLSNEAKAQLQSLQFCDAELARLTSQASIIQTARIAYAKALQAALPSPLEWAQASETLKFN